MRYDVEMPDIYFKVWQALLTVTLEVGIHGFFGVHLVFKLLMLLCLTEIPFVPGHDSGVRNYSAYALMKVR